MVMNVDTAGAGSGIPVSADIKIRSQSEAAVCSTAILDFSRRGKPTDNATIESFNGRFREECLNVHWFASLEDAQQKIDAFRWDYNEHHPHRYLKGLSPREFAHRILATAANSPS
jgi:transposase InsO family protein